MERPHAHIQRKEYAPRNLEVVPANGEHDPHELEPTSPEERNHVSLVIIGLIEVLNGQRSLRQLEQHLSVPLYSVLSKRLPKSKTREALTLRTLHFQKPRPEVIEANGIVVVAKRARAIVARFHHYRRGWLCVTADLI